MRTLLRLTRVAVLLGLMTSAAQAASDDLVVPWFNASGGFCPDGVYFDTRWPHGERPEGAVVWGSYCAQQNEGTGRIESSPFLAPTFLQIYMAGYPGTPALRIGLRNAAGDEMELRPESVPRETWQLSTFPIPAGWAGRPVRLFAEDREAGIPGWLAFTAPELPYSSVAIGAIPTNTPQSGFCPNGVYPSTLWPDRRPPESVVTWGSYCQAGNAGTGWMASKPVPAEGYLKIYLAGYPGNADVRLAVENVQTGVQLPLQVRDFPREVWQPYYFPLPSDWRGQSIRVVAEDRATGWWLGFTEPLADDGRDAGFALELSAWILVLFIILLIPPAGVCALAKMRGIDDIVDLQGIALLAIGLLGWMAFWVYFLSPSAGIVFSYTVLLGSLAWLGYAIKRHQGVVSALKQLLRPWVLVACASFFVLSLGLVHNALESPLRVAAHRFAPPQFEADNEIPKVFADGVFSGHVPRPLMATWLSSDRPPLQAGLTLWNYGWTWGNRDLPYLVIGVILQCMFLIGLWIYLKAARVGRGAMTLALLAAFLSGFTILNSFYTWPKLFPVAFLFVVAANVLTERFRQGQERWVGGVVTGAAAALAMLCHGGSVFALLGIAAAMAVLRRQPSRRFLLGALAAASLLYVPWVGYQKLCDPPGDRLLKWHLAGVERPHPDARLGGLLLTNYGKLGLGGTVRNKAGNVALLASDTGAAWGGTWDVFRNLLSGRSAGRQEAAASVRKSMALYWLPCLGLSILGPLALLLQRIEKRTASAEYQSACILWLSATSVLVVWCLLMFGPDSTYIFQGSYFSVIAAIAGSAVAWCGLSPRIALILTAVGALISAGPFVWFSWAPRVGLGGPLGPANVVLEAICVLSGAALIVVLAWQAPGESGLWNLMMRARPRAKSFQDLLVWRKAHELVLAVNTLTDAFPKPEAYGLSLQMRHSAVSIPANIAGGFGRRNRTEKARFLNMAESSLEETRYFLILTRDVGYGDTASLMASLEEVSRLLNAYRHSDLLMSAASIAKALAVWQDRGIKGGT